MNSSEVQEGKKRGERRENDALLIPRSGIGAIEYREKEKRASRCVKSARERVTPNVSCPGVISV